jgi:hypothetical protein
MDALKAYTPLHTWGDPLGCSCAIQTAAQILK